MLPLRRSAALAVLMVLCACNAVSVSESTAPTRSAPSPTTSSGPTPTPASTAAAISTPAPSPAATPSAIDALMHCTGTASTGTGRSFERNSTWAGYVAASPPGTFSCVEGSWIEPVVTCGEADAAVGFWVGIGGYSSRDLEITDDDHAMERAGTGVECEDGEADHYAWYQMDPRDSGDVLFGPTPGEELAIVAGDEMWAQVRYATGAYVMTVANRTTGDVRSILVAASGKRRSSAEWIVGGEDGEPMARYDKITITSGMATMDGILGTVGSTAWLRNEIDEWAGGVRRLRVSELSADGASFRVTWLHR